MSAIQSVLVSWKDPFATLQSMVTIAAIMFGGIFAYFKLFKGRTYVQRLEPSASVTLLDNEAYPCALVSISVKNVGLSRVDIDRDDSKLQVYAYIQDDYIPEFHGVFWTRLGTVDALQHHAWVEPGETVTEHRLFALPKIRPVAIGLRLRLLPLRPTYSFGRKRSEWNALAVAPPKVQNNNRRDQCGKEMDHAGLDQKAGSGGSGRDKAAERRGGATTA